jgi:hypothetical protein
VFETRVPRAIFGTMRKKVGGEWKKLFQEELYKYFLFTE